jgi:putative DNA primase/helicase
MSTPENLPAAPLAVIPENIPADLRALPQWVVWRVEIRNGKPTKPPFNACTGRYAKSNDPATWCDFPTALNAYRKGRWAGIGFAFLAGDGLCGVDIDHVIDRSSGAVESWALEVVEKFRGAYIETSPSGAGIRIFCRGKAIRAGKGTLEKRIELYDYSSARYLTVTGAVWAR